MKGGALHYPHHEMCPNSSLPKEGQGVVNAHHRPTLPPAAPAPSLSKGRSSDPLNLKLPENRQDFRPVHTIHTRATLPLLFSVKLQTSNDLSIYLMAFAGSYSFCCKRNKLLFQWPSRQAVEPRYLLGERPSCLSK
jgi:hypothetical protein